MQSRIAFEHNSSDDCAKIVIEDYLPLVQRIVRHMISTLPSYIQMDELISLGTLGLVEAARRYNPGEGVKFETFASWRIRGAILDGLRDNDWIPRHLRKQIKEMEDAYGIIESREQRAATDEEICDYLGITRDELNRRLSQVEMGTFLSLDNSFMTDGDETSLQEVLADPQGVDPFNETYRKEIAGILEQAIDRLPEKEKWVVSLYYYEELTLREIAEVLQLTPSRISQLHTKAICRLRGALSRKKRYL